MGINTQLKFRHYRPSDLEAVAALVNEVREAEGEPDAVSQGNIEHQLNNPLIDPSRDLLLALDGERLVALALTVLMPSGHAVSYTFIHPDYDTPDLRAYYVANSEENVRSRMDAVVEADKAVTHYIGSTQENAADRIDLYKSLGYEAARRFYVMQIKLYEAPPTPQFPGTIELRPFNAAQYSRAVHSAHQEAWRDHWNHVEDVPYERWTLRLSGPLYDSSLYIIAWDGDEVAGLALCHAA